MALAALPVVCFRPRISAPTDVEVEYSGRRFVSSLTPLGDGVKSSNVKLRRSPFKEASKFKQSHHPHGDRNPDLFCSRRKSRGIRVEVAVGVEIESSCCSSKREIWQDGEFGVVWETEDIAQVVDGVLLRTGARGSICTDSRKINPGEWFLALQGPNFDGGDFLSQAVIRGCAGVISSRAMDPDWPAGFVLLRNGNGTGDGGALRALQRLAACARRRYEGPVVGITGSTGKTTVTAMTTLALEALGDEGDDNGNRRKVHQTDGNFNNHIGVPLTLLKLPSTATACVLEMGMNHAGEILELADIAQPSVRVVVNVGVAHMEHFNTLENVAAAKGEILREARPGDVCVLNADDELVMSLPVRAGVRVVLFGRRAGCHVRIVSALATRGGRAVKVVLEQSHTRSISAENYTSGFQILEHLTELSATCNVEIAHCCTESSVSISMSNEGDHGPVTRKPTLSFGHQSIRESCPTQDSLEKIDGWTPPSSKGWPTISRVEFELSSPGLHLAENACAAAAVAISLGVPLQRAGQSLSTFSPIGRRAKLEDLGGGIQLIDDAYNCNPISLVAGLRLLRSIACEGRRVAILGDMLELGHISERAHLDALSLCQQLELDVVGLVGPLFSKASCSRGLHEDNSIFIVGQDPQKLASRVAETLRPGDVVLVKGSHGLRMEVVADAIRGIALRANAANDS